MGKYRNDFDGIEQVLDLPPETPNQERPQALAAAGVGLERPEGHVCMTIRQAAKIYNVPWRIIEKAIRRRELIGVDFGPRTDFRIRAGQMDDWLRRLEERYQPERMEWRKP